MNNEKINERLAQLIYPDAHKVEIDGVYVKKPTGWMTFNPASNWSDLMPIVVKLKLSLNVVDFDDESLPAQFKWQAESFYGDYRVDRECPLQALALCAIRVLEGE